MNTHMDDWTDVLSRVVLVANRKGGVLKSSLVRAIAAVLTAAGYRVLVVDGDPQGNVSKIDFGLETDRGRALAMAMQYGTDLTPETVRGVDVISGGPELQGALGAATHMARLVPQHLMRTLYFTARTIPAKDLVQHGSVYGIAPRAELDDLALSIAGEVAAKDPRVIRAAKEALNGIEDGDLEHKYRWEQGFTAQAYLSAESQEARDAFVGKRAADFEQTKAKQD